MELICKCGEPMSEHDPGVDKVSSYFTLSFSCTSCDSTAEVSFTAFAEGGTYGKEQGKLKQIRFKDY